jgi:capsular exopolysaccharide synthesis family protein
VSEKRIRRKGRRAAQKGLPNGFFAPFAQFLASGTRENSRDDLVLELSDGSVSESAVTALEIPRQRSLVLASTKAAEGVSTCSAGLAHYLARDLNSRVLLVDANFGDPAVHRFAGIENGPGLAAVLRGEVPLDKAVRATEIENLSVLTAGESKSDPSSLFQSPGWRERLGEDLRRLPIGFVIFDCPPVTDSAEATLVGPLCDGVILVVEGGRAPRQAIQTAASALRRSGCDLLGVILNKRRYYIPQFIYDRL